MLKRASCLLAVTGGVLLMAVASASATTTFTVNDTTDAPLLATTTGKTCVSTHAGTCTLRAAIQAADNLGGAVTITLPAGTYTLTIPAASTGTPTDDPSTGDLDIDQLNGASNPPNVTISGAGADATVINANSIDRAFMVHTDNGSGYPQLTVSGVTIEGGAPSSHSYDSGDGGAINNEGATLTILNSMLTDNTVTREGGAVYTEGAGITITGSTIAGNSGLIAGGGIAITGGVAQLTNDTFDGNSSQSGGGLAYLQQTTGASELLNVTVAHNSATFGGGIYSPVYALAIENTIVAANNNTGGAGGAADCYGPTVDTNAPDEASTADVGGNLDSDGTCFSNGLNGDVTGADAKLGTLSDSKGGATPTDAIDAGSPAIFLARASACPSVDQRGQARLSAFCDAGAYQGDEADLSLGAAGTTSTGVGNTFVHDFTVTNNGPYSASGVTFTDQLPSGVTGSASASQGACTGGAKAGSTISCALGSLTSSQTGGEQSATITLTLSAAAAGSVADTGTVTASSLDPKTANNSATANTAVESPPTNIGYPAVEGATWPPIKGDTLTANPGTWTGSNVQFSYQWLDCPIDFDFIPDCTPIAGATGSTYVVSGKDVGHTILFEVTATDAFGNKSLYSDPTRAALGGLLQVSSAQPNGGTVVLPLECADPALDAVNPECLLLIVLSGGSVNQNALAVSHGKPKPKATIYASKKVKIAAGRKVKIPVALNHAGQLLLAKRHRLVLKLTISENGHILSSRMVTFKYKAPKKRESAIRRRRG